MFISSSLESSSHVGEKRKNHQKKDKQPSYVISVIKPAQVHETNMTCSGLFYFRFIVWVPIETMKAPVVSSPPQPLVSNGPIGKLLFTNDDTNLVLNPIGS